MNNEEEMPCRRGCAKNRLKPENKERACEQRFFFFKCDKKYHPQRAPAARLRSACVCARASSSSSSSISSSSQRLVAASTSTGMSAISTARDSCVLRAARTSSSAAAIASAAALWSSSARRVVPSRVDTSYTLLALVVMVKAVARMPKVPPSRTSQPSSVSEMAAE